MSDAIVVENLHKSFPSRRGEVRALQGASFRVPRGTIFGLLGPNGAGKTTALRILSTILRPSAGVARIDEIEVTAEPEQIRRRIGYLTGKTGLYGRLTPREMILYYGRLHGMDEERLRGRCEELLSALDLTGLADRYNATLSDGEKQRVSIARAVVHDPAVLILDEPMSALDVLSSRGIVEFMREARSRGKTVLFSSHNLMQAERLCDAFAILHRGRILAEGTLEDLRKRTGASNLEEIFIRLVGNGHAMA